MYALMGVFLLVILWQVMPKESKSRLSTIWSPEEGPANAYASAMGRVEGYRAGIAIFKRFPLAGIGIGNFVEYLRKCSGRNMKLVIAGGGTGGHIFSGIAVAQEWERRGGEVLFIGTSQGLEKEIIPKWNFKLELIPVRSLKGGRILSRLKTLFGLPRAFLKSLRTRLGPIPTKTSTNSLPEIERNGTPASVAMAFAK